jgi:hypothetical protein
MDGMDRMDLMDESTVNRVNGVNVSRLLARNTITCQPGATAPKTVTFPQFSSSHGNPIKAKHFSGEPDDKTKPTRTVWSDASDPPL